MNILTRFVIGQPLTPAESWIVLIVAFAFVMLVAGLCGLLIEWIEDRRARRQAKREAEAIHADRQIDDEYRLLLAAIAAHSDRDRVIRIEEWSKRIH